MLIISIQRIIRNFAYSHICLPMWIYFVKFVFLIFIYCFRYSPNCKIGLITFESCLIFKCIQLHFLIFQPFWISGVRNFDFHFPHTECYLATVTSIFTSDYFSFCTTKTRKETHKTTILRNPWYALHLYGSMTDFGNTRMNGWLDVPAYFNDAPHVWIHASMQLTTDYHSLERLKIAP